MKNFGCIFLPTLILGCDGYYGYPNPGEGCFTAGTRILVPSGDKAIELLAVGDTVYAFDAERGQLVTGVIDEVRQRTVTRVLNMTLGNGKTLHVTEDHPLYNAESLSWHDAGGMSLSDELMILDPEGTLIPTPILNITSTESSDGIPVYNFKVREYMTSFAEGVLAHFYDD